MRATLVCAADGAATFLPYQSPALASGEWSDVTLALSGVRQPGAALAPLSYRLYETLGEDVLSMVVGARTHASANRLATHASPYMHARLCW